MTAIYERYVGWYDANPAHLWERPSAASAERHVDYMGGWAAVLTNARQAFQEGDYRWVVQVHNYVIFAEPDNLEARQLQADTLEQLGRRGERHVAQLLAHGAFELRRGYVGTPTAPSAPDLARRSTSSTRSPFASTAAAPGRSP